MVFVRVDAGAIELPPVSDAGETGVEEGAAAPIVTAAEAAPAPPPPRCLVAGFVSFRISSSLSVSTMCHFIPFPGSSVRRGVFLKALFRDRLCRMEF